MTAPRKQPKDHKKPADEDVYEFEHNGETYTLPPYKSIKPGLMRRVRKLTDMDATFTILEEIAPKDTLAALDDMTMERFDAVITGWLEHSGITPGESSSSST